MIHPGEVMVALTALFMGGFVLYPIARAIGKRLEGKPAPPPALVAPNDPRLERMEQALEAIAVEIERISEAQRFTTKLLAERSSPAALPGDVSRRP